MQPRNPNNARGCDISHYQGAIDWPQVFAAGYRFAICKATDGRVFTDDTLSANLTGAKGAGLGVTAYHFFRASNVTEAKQEADFFLSVLDDVGGASSLDFPPMLDVETHQNVTPDQLVACIKVWMDEVSKRIGAMPMIYTYPGFIDNRLNDESLSAYKLHYAFYSDDAPADRGPWKEWTFLQYNDRETVPGVPGPCDVDEFAGSEFDLMGYKMSSDDANKLIDKLLSPLYMFVQSDEDRKELHRLGNELRKASGQPEQ